MQIEKEQLLNIFWINLEVIFSSKMPLLNDQKNEVSSGATGFFQEYGCTADDENELKEIIHADLNEMEWLDLLKTKISFERIGIISQEEIQSEIYADLDIREALKANPRKKGIWYKSGKAFFTEEDGSDGYYQVEPHEY